ncbi:MAG: hypothetical protein HFF03_03385 [Oscillospiraceae bacterium]|nr:hypothetical protein [Oscillospiraceae bacterium]
MKLDSIGQDTLTRLGVCVVVSVALLYGAEALLDGKSIPLWEKYGPWLKDNKVQAIAILAAVLYGAWTALAEHSDHPHDEPEGPTFSRVEPL